MKSFVLQEAYPLPRVDETLAQLTRATPFSKLDANSGLWQIPLAKMFRPSLLLSLHLDATILKKLPFRISSAPDYFQRRLSEILEGLEGVLCHG